MILESISWDASVNLKLPGGKRRKVEMDSKDLPQLPVMTNPKKISARTPLLLYQDFSPSRSFRRERPNSECAVPCGSSRSLKSSISWILVNIGYPRDPRDPRDPGFWLTLGSQCMHKKQAPQGPSGDFAFYWFAIFRAPIASDTIRRSL